MISPPRRTKSWRGSPNWQHIAKLEQHIAKLEQALAQQK
jgi:hypothetical protein